MVQIDGEIGIVAGPAGPSPAVGRPGIFDGAEGIATLTSRGSTPIRRRFLKWTRF
jgi:hypothetical protein